MASSFEFIETGLINALNNAQEKKTKNLPSPYFSQHCKYDPCGNLILNTLDGIEHQYTYDDLWQLTEERALKHSDVYEYDPLYNKLSENGRRAEYNELLSLEGIDCSYDVNGNLISKTTLNGTFQFAYDPLNRLIEVSNEKCQVSFSYDPLGRCLVKLSMFLAFGMGGKNRFRKSISTMAIEKSERLMALLPNLFASLENIRRPLP